METCNSSMQLTRAADYGVRVMIHLAGLSKHQRLSLTTLARETMAPESFLSKVLQALTRAQFVTSHRGQGGGFEISPLGRGTSVRQVVEAIDGPIHLNVCLDHGRACARRDWCPAHPVWVKAQQAMFEVLDSALVADLATQPSFVQIETGTASAARELAPQP